MNSLKTTDRIAFILKIIKDYKHISKSKLFDLMVNHDYVSSSRTFERDLERIRNLCFINIQYNRAENYYYIAEESLEDTQQWLQVFELLATAKAIDETLFRSNKNISYIDFDRSTLRFDPKVMSQLLKAILDRTEIRFQHANFWSNHPKKVILYPHLLKQYQNRWYIFGCFPNGEFRNFGIDRISNLVLSENTFKSKMKDPKKAFDDVVGLVYSISNIETVVLSYLPDQGKYIKSQPLHPSQIILVDTEKELRIQVRVRPNYELEEQILKQGDRVKVIGPESLRHTIKNRIKKALGQYG